MLIEYPKIETIWERAEDGSKALLRNHWRNPAVEYLATLPWSCTEKIDGTNIRVYWDGHSITFAGRTDRATIPGPLLDHLRATFTDDPAVEELFEQKFGDKEVILFGEGYGPKIQKSGELYRDTPSFILFDVWVNGLWLNRSNMVDIAHSFGIDFVPWVNDMPLHRAVEYVESKPHSYINEAHEMEGLVCKPLYPLRDRNGDRLVVKIKARDFPLEGE